MATVKLSENEIEYLQTNYPKLNYDEKSNLISGDLSFDLHYEHTNVPAIKDTYKIELDLGDVNEGIPIIREINNRILGIANKKNLFFGDLHLNNKNGEMCIIIPPKIKERYPNGFDLTELLHHIEEHLYWISYFEKYDKKPWKESGHGEIGYLELYLEDKQKYASAVKAYFKTYSRQTLRKKIRELKKKYKL